LTFVTLLQLSPMLSPVAPLPSSSTTARHLHIGNGNDAITHHNEGNNTIAMTAKTPAHRQQ
jgi:hypothetical protein